MGHADNAVHGERASHPNHNEPADEPWGTRRNDDSVSLAKSTREFRRLNDESPQSCSVAGILGLLDDALPVGRQEADGSQLCPSTLPMAG
jgi:hypothetical protein